MKKIFTTIFLATTILLFGFSAIEVSGNTEQFDAFIGSDGANISGETPKDPRYVIANIIQWAMTLVGTLSLIYGIYGGFMILTSEGESDKIETGKSTLLTSTIGIIVALSAYSITLFVASNLWEATGSGGAECDPEKEFCQEGEIRVEEETDLQQDKLGPKNREGDKWYEWGN